MTVQCEAPPVKSIVVGMGEMQIAKGPGAVLACLGMGSCVALCVYDPTNRVGGMVHIVLPLCDGRDGGPSPKYADTAVPLLLDGLRKHGAGSSRLVVKIAGGAQMSLAPGVSDLFKIGERNVEATRAAIARVGLAVAAADTGGHKGRTIRMHLDTGRVVVTTVGKESKYL